MHIYVYIHTHIYTYTYIHVYTTIFTTGTTKLRGGLLVLQGLRKPVDWKEGRASRASRASHAETDRLMFLCPAVPMFR